MVGFSNELTTLSASRNNIIKVDEFQRAQSVYGGPLTEAIQSLYSLVLWDTIANSTLIDQTLDPTGTRPGAEYFFRVPPKVHEFGEPFSSTLIPTQNAGMFIENNGSIIREVSIQGTTGLRPNKVAPGRIPGLTGITGINQNQIDTLLGAGINGNIRQVPNGEITGYDDLVFLRNMFRKYSDVKQTDALAGRVVMLWRNIKDADYWVVEPSMFRINQSSSSPMTYEYNISLRTVSKFSFMFNLGPDPLASFRSIQRLMARLQEYSQNLLGIFFTVSNQINRVLGEANALSNLFLSPLINVINGLTAVKSSVTGLDHGLRQLAQNMADSCTEAYNTLVSDFTVQDSIPNAILRARAIAIRLLNEPVTNDTINIDSQAALNRYARAYTTAGSFTQPDRSPTDSPSFIGNTTIGPNVSSTICGPDEDLRDIARRTLGDGGRWRELVIINRLSPPYISATGGAGVLAPGDTIVFPVASGVSGSSVTGGSSSTANSTEVGSDIGPIQQAYGCDLRLSSNGDELTDIEISQTGDISTIQGVPNVKQAILVKFATEQGELPAHPKFGARFGIGSKATPASFNEFRINTINTIMTDPRVATVDDIRFVMDGDVLAVTSKLTLVGAQDSLSTNFALRRF